jgi:hypothetical protein
VQSGYRVKFFHDFYGRQWIELRPRWLFWPKKRIHLSADEVLRVKAALGDRRGMRAQAAKHAN